MKINNCVKCGKKAHVDSIMDSIFVTCGEHIGECFSYTPWVYENASEDSAEIAAISAWNKENPEH